MSNKLLPLSSTVGPSSLQEAVLLLFCQAVSVGVKGDQVQLGDGVSKWFDSGLFAGMLLRTRCSSRCTCFHVCAFLPIAGGLQEERAPSPFLADVIASTPGTLVCVCVSRCECVTVHFLIAGYVRASTSVRSCTSLLRSLGVARQARARFDALHL